MRKQFKYTVLILLVCSLFVSIAVFAITRSTQTEICSVAEEQTENIKSLDGSLLWESLSRQFVSSVHQ